LANFFCALADIFCFCAWACAGIAVSVYWGSSSKSSTQCRQGMYLQQAQPPGFRYHENPVQPLCKLLHCYTTACIWFCKSIDLVRCESVACLHAEAARALLSQSTHAHDLIAIQELILRLIEQHSICSLQHITQGPHCGVHTIVEHLAAKQGTSRLEG
jgi:hypothetical protein